MVAYWIKLLYERNTYVVDLDDVGTFVCDPSNRLSFYVPGSRAKIILTKQNHLEAYEQVLNYLQQITADAMQGYWVTIEFERNKYIVDLDRVRAFIQTTNDRLMFYPEGNQSAIVITAVADPATYRKLIHYIEQRTGHRLA